MSHPEMSDEFLALVDANMARIASFAAKLSPGGSLRYRERLFFQTLNRVWPLMPAFDAATDGAFITWFQEHMRVVSRSVDRTAPVAPVIRTAQVPRRRKPAVHRRQQAVVVSRPSALNVLSLPRQVKECPPCWRCRWFDGWLPATGFEITAPVGIDDDVRAACYSLDTNKVRIANEVRSRGKYRD